ncbi:MAG TPA: acyl-CoA dehydrogenase family protein, partial [Rhodospirillales bacterium]|nr:acyl-CoA dehydrogenase family protein [Rhodospirillales bacterium]
MSDTPIIDDLLPTCENALEAAEILLGKIKDSVGSRVIRDGRVDGKLIDAEQFAAHGLSWSATYVEALRQMHGWGQRLEANGNFGELEQLILQSAFGEYLSQLYGGIPLSQVEIIRPRDMGIASKDTHAFFNDGVKKLIGGGNTNATRMHIAKLIEEGADSGYFGDPCLDDEMLDMVRDQFRRFVNEQVLPDAHEWHLKDELIPMEIVEQMAELGVFGLTIPEEFGGLGMGKTAMCVVTEELSRGYIGVGSLGTRSEIAAELIRLGGTDEQKQHYLPKIASGEILPTAVFTEPGTGSDLASLKTRGTLEGDVYKVTGNKTWITHAARSDMMTLLCRT